jgi:hypothetical protein
MLALGGESDIPTKVTSEIIEHIVKRLKEPQWQSLREYLVKKGLNPNETPHKDMIAAVPNPTDVPSSQIPHIANYYILGDFVAVVFEPTSLKAVSRFQGAVRGQV